MNVYVVVNYHWSKGGARIEKVFTTREKAEEYFVHKEPNSDETNVSILNVEKYEVE